MKSDLGTRLAAMPPEKRLYALRALPAVLAQTQRISRLFSLVTNPHFVLAKLETMGLTAVQSDFELARQSVFRRHPYLGLLEPWEDAMKTGLRARADFELAKQGVSPDHSYVELPEPWGDVVKSSLRARADTELNAPRTFLSHSSKDHRFVHRLATDPKRDGVKVWVDEAEMRPGDRLVDKIEQGIEESDFMIVVLSRASIHRGWESSRWVTVDLNAAFVGQTQTWRTTILLCRIEDCRVPTLLKGLVWADFAKKPYDEAYQDLLIAIFGGIEQNA